MYRHYKRPATSTQDKAFAFLCTAPYPPLGASEPFFPLSSLLHMFNFHAFPGKASLWNYPCWSPGWKTVFSPVLTFCGLYILWFTACSPLFAALWMDTNSCFSALKKEQGRGRTGETKRLGLVLLLNCLLWPEDAFCVMLCWWHRNVPRKGRGKWKTQKQSQMYGITCDCLESSCIVSPWNTLWPFSMMELHSTEVLSDLHLEGTRAGV